MAALRKAILLAAALATTPVVAQVRPPEYVAQTVGAEDCVRLTREVGRASVITGRYINRGPTSFFGVTADFDAAFCFRSQQACERFVNEMRFDYPEGSGACRPGG